MKCQCFGATSRQAVQNAILKTVARGDLDFDGRRYFATPDYLEIAAQVIAEDHGETMSGRMIGHDRAPSGDGLTTVTKKSRFLSGTGIDRMINKSIPASEGTKSNRSIRQPVF
jgi:hypothetical protein